MRTGFPCCIRQLDDFGILAILLVLEADVAGIDAVLGKCFRAGGVLTKQRVPDVMKVTDKGDITAQGIKLFADVRYGFCGVISIDRDPHQLRTGPRQGRHLRHCLCDVGGISVGHRLNDDRRAAADGNTANVNSNRSASGSDRIAFHIRTFTLRAC